MIAVRDRRPAAGDLLSTVGSGGGLTRAPAILRYEPATREPNR